ncbi:hypothetical protein BJY00DRAFT_312106 [Aspergillus carlsbadensis]|nr:hypothetical protein BJY00DRAFT_312106 [Aspergillus carlsbadensis]
MPSAKLDLSVGFSAPDPDLFENWVLILSPSPSTSTSTSSSASAKNDNAQPSTPPESTFYYTLNGVDTDGFRLDPFGEFHFERFVTTGTTFTAWPIDKVEKICTIDASHKKYVDKAATEGPTQNSQFYIVLLIQRLGNHGVIPLDAANKWTKRSDDRLQALAEFATVFNDETLGLTLEQSEERWKEFKQKRGFVCRWTFAYLWQRRRWVAKN